MEIDIKEKIAVIMPPIDSAVILEYISNLESLVELFEENERAHWQMNRGLEAQNTRLLEVMRHFSSLDEEWILEVLNTHADDIDKRADVSAIQSGIIAARAAIAETEKYAPS